MPDALRVDPHPWFALAVTTLGGAAVGVVVRFAPGHGGPRPTAGHGVGETHIGLRPLPGIVLASIISLAIGASLGPEAPLLAVVAATAPWIALRINTPGLAPLITQAGIGSIFALLFGSPLAATFVGLETIVIAGRTLYTFLIPVLVASTTGFLGFRAITHHSLTSLANLEFPAYPQLEIRHFPVAIAIGAAGAFLGLIQVAAFRTLDRALRPLDRVPVAKATLGGIGIGLVALIAGEETLFSGEHELDVLLHNAGAKSVGTLVLIIAGKLVANSISMATGFRGGKIFPIVFIGGTLGIAAHQAFTSIPLAVAVACGMAGATMVILRPAGLRDSLHRVLRRTAARTADRGGRGDGVRARVRQARPRRRSTGHAGAPSGRSPTRACERAVESPGPLTGAMMAIGIRIKIHGVTAELFDKLNAVVDPDRNPPQGLIFHASGPVDGGWGVLDFWESRADFDRFAAERIGPAMAAIGATGQPDIHEFPVHEHFPR